jgi:hypothetical protein
MTGKLSPAEIAERFLRALPEADWEYDADADEMEVMLPGAIGRTGLSVLVDDESYLRVDVETHEPLSLVIQPWSYWSARQDAAVASQCGKDRLGEWARRPRPSIAGAVERRVRESVPHLKLAA